MESKKVLHIFISTLFILQISINYSYPVILSPTFDSSGYSLPIYPDSDSSGITPPISGGTYQDEIQYQQPEDPGYDNIDISGDYGYEAGFDPELPFSEFDISNWLNSEYALNRGIAIANITDPQILDYVAFQDRELDSDLGSEDIIALLNNPNLRETTTTCPSIIIRFYTIRS